LLCHDDPQCRISEEVYAYGCLLFGTQLRPVKPAGQY
jgi:hypothetical protein